ncbi:hypothetical protein DVH24_001666 [Malus domestica]|uniref:Uncharacterized protein n=1 Tax=Malus domestica TaxID=3750 RepID=A0A498I2D9_MALDO|nr:hypothetical protein DVH24_001666 [Malus domestica]
MSNPMWHDMEWQQRGMLASSQLSIKPLIVPEISSSSVLSFSLTSTSPYLLGPFKSLCRTIKPRWLRHYYMLDDLAFWLPTQILNDEDPPTMELNSNTMKSGGFGLRFDADAPNAQK